MVFAALVWFFYLLICPVVTVVVIGSMVKRPAETVQDHVRRAASTIAALTLVLGPVQTNGGFMPWWDVPFLASFANSKLYILEYAGICAALYWALYAVRVKLGSKKERTARVDEG